MLLHIEFVFLCKIVSNAFCVIIKSADTLDVLKQ